MYLSRSFQSLLFSSFLLLFSACNNNETNNNSPSSIIIDHTAPQGVHINEFLASNLHTKMDRDFYQFSDWIEIFNNTNQTADISGYALSDDADNPTKWKFPQNTTIPAHGYLLVWADKKDSRKKELHTNFKLSSKEEDLLFTDRDGNRIDQIHFKEQVADISCAPANKGVVYMHPTPASTNSKAHSNNSRSQLPHFSNQGGFTSATTLTLSANNSAAIYYTTDGSIPTQKSTRYTAPININKTSLIQAIAIEEGQFPSTVVSKTFLIGVESTIPVISLATDPDYLYDDEVGIYVDGTNGIPLPNCRHNNTTPHNFAQDWERPVYLSYYDANNQEQFSIGADFAISGQCSRYNKKKSFKFDLDSKYGTKSLDYQLYQAKHLNGIKDFKLRAGNFGYEFGDILAAKLVESGHLNIDYQAYTPVRMFLNGAYWGLYNIREKKGADYIASNYPEVSKKRVDIIKNSKLVKAGDIEAYKVLEKARTYDQIIALIDEDNFIDYAALMIYSGNEDWSYSNCRAWRERKDSAQWRWMLDDIDEGFQDYVLNINNLNGPDGITSEYHELSTIFNTLMSNSTFKSRFKNRFNTLLETTFSPSNVKKLIDEIVQERAAYMSLDNPSLHEQSYWYSDYLKYIENTKDFAERRSAIVKGQLSSF
jgi:hypothetical protein